MDLRLKTLLNPKTYLWIDVLLIKETKRAILIEFDDRKIWLPKTWIVRMTRNRHSNAIFIKISEHHWAVKLG